MDVKIIWEEETDDRERLLHGTRWYLNAGSFTLGTVYEDTVNRPYSPPHLWKRWDARVVQSGCIGEFLTEEEAKQALFERVMKELSAPPQEGADERR